MKLIKYLKNIKSNQNKGPNQNPEFTKLIGDQRRRQQAYDAFDDSDSGRPETGNTLNNTKMAFIKERGDNMFPPWGYGLGKVGLVEEIKEKLDKIDERLYEIQKNN